jgi:hypothetical protein
MKMTEGNRAILILVFMMVAFIGGFWREKKQERNLDKLLVRGENRPRLALFGNRMLSKILRS